MSRISKSIMSFLLILIMLVSICSVVGTAAGVDITFTGGSGTEKDPYQISTAKQLSAMRNNLSAHYVLVQNINLSNYKWTPVGTGRKPFTGTFNGKGHIISNLSISDNLSVSSSDDNNQHYGLFGYVYGATIENVGISNGYYNITTENHTREIFLNVGGIIGAENYSDIRQCFFDGRIVVSSKKYVYIRAGGIVASSQDGTIKNCYSKASITATGYNMNTMVGGICAWLDDSDIHYCYASGHLSADSGYGYLYIGGLNASSGSENSFVMQSVVLKSSINATAKNTSYIYKNDMGNFVDFVSCKVYDINSSAAKKQESYENYGWDFKNIWIMNGSYPHLQVFLGKKALEQIQVKQFETESQTMDISMGDSIQFPIPEDIPLIGGRSFSFDVACTPISAKFTKDKITIGIGCKDITKMNNSDWCSFKNYIHSTKKSIEKEKKYYDASAFGVVDTGFNKSFKVGLHGYFEANIKNGKLTNPTGIAKLTITGQAGRTWYTVIYGIPVYLDVVGKISLDSKVTIGFDMDKSELMFKSSFDLALPTVTIAGGVGIKQLLSGEVYGKVDNNICFEPSSKHITATLKGQIGLNGRFLGLSGTHILYNSKEGWTYYDNHKNKYAAVASLASFCPYTKGLSEEDFVIDRSYLQNQSNWSPTISSKKEIASLGSGSTMLLQSDIYPGANPKLVTSNDTTMMVWIADIKERTDANHTAVVYSIYDKATFTWSEPTIIDDDGTADSYVDITSNGENIYVTWVDSNTIMDSTTTLEETAAGCEINVAKYDFVNSTFTDIQTITDNSSIDSYPAIKLVDNQPVVVWENNSDNSVINFSGTDTIYYATQNMDGSYLVKEHFSSSNAIYSFATDGTNIAYIADTDSDPSTYNDIEIFAGAIGDIPNRITSNTESESKLTSSVINGKNYFTFLSDSTLYGTTDMTNIAPLSDENCLISGDYQFVSNGEITKFLSTEADKDCSNIYSYSLNDKGLWCNPVKITDSNTYVKDSSAIINDNNDLQISYLSTTVNFTDTSLTENCDLHTIIVSDKHDIVLNYIDYLPENIVDKGTLPVTVNITNNGTYAENTLTINVKDSLNSSTIYTTKIDETIASGETKDISFDLPLPSYINGKHEYTVTVTPSSGDMNKDDNSLSLTFGYTDLQLITNTVNSGYSAGSILTIINPTCIDTNATLLIKANNSDGEVLDEFYLGTIETTEVYYLLSKEKLIEYSAVADNIYIEVISEKEEIANADNFAYINVSDTISELFGDVNRDGIISVSDATDIQFQIAQLSQLTNDQLSAADTQLSGSIDILDVTNIQMYLANYVTSSLIGENLRSKYTFNDFADMYNTLSTKVDDVASEEYNSNNDYLSAIATLKEYKSLVSNQLVSYYEIDKAYIECQKAYQSIKNFKDNCVYLNPGIWNTDSPVFAAYFYNNKYNTNYWVEMSLCSDGKYSAKIPTGYTNLVFVRLNPQGTIDWNSKWNQTEDLSIVKSGTYTITDWGTEKSVGHWS